MTKILNLRVLQHYDEDFDEEQAIFITKFRISDDDLKKSVEELYKLIEISYGCFKCCCLGEYEQFSVIIDCDDSQECEGFGIYHSTAFYNGGDDFIYANANCDFLEEKVDKDIMRYYEIPKKYNVSYSDCIKEFLKSNPDLKYDKIRRCFELGEKKIFEYEIVDNILKTFLGKNASEIYQ